MPPERVVRELAERVWDGGELDRLPEFFAETIGQGGRRDNLAGLRARHDQVGWCSLLHTA